MLCTRSGHRFAWGLGACLLALGGAVPTRAAEPQFTPVAQAVPGVLQTAPAQPKGALSEQARQRLADHAARPAPVSGRVANEVAPALSTARQVAPNHLEPLWGQDALPAPKGDTVPKPQATKVAAPSAVAAPRAPQSPKVAPVPPVPAATVGVPPAKSTKPKPAAVAGAKGRAGRSERAALHTEAERAAKVSLPRSPHRKLGAHADQAGKSSPKPAGKTPGVAAASRAKSAGKQGVFHVKHGARTPAAKAAATKSKSAKPTSAKPTASKGAAVKPAGKGHTSPARASGKAKLAKPSKGTKASAAKGAKSAQGKHPATRHRS
jgi:hypothetical protein